MTFLKFAAVVIALLALVHYRRYGLRQAWYILRTGDTKPDFEKIDPDYYLAPLPDEKPKRRFWPL